MAIRKRDLDLLRPWLVGEQSREGTNGREWDMFCPLHEDGKRSAQLNVDTGEWYCHGGCGGGTVKKLLKQKDEWILPKRSGYTNGNGNGSSAARKTEVITEAKVAGWCAALESTPEAMEYLENQRGLSEDTIKSYEIGWDKDKNAFTIPVRSPDGEFWNIRRYDPAPVGERRKIWSITGLGSPRLYPLSVVCDSDPRELIICEGEWDCLLTNQMGFPCITRTASATTWEAQWGEYFKGRIVYVCHDADKTGEAGARKIAIALRQIADVRIVHLPYAIREKHGKDLTDYWQEGHTAEQFRELLLAATPGDPNTAPIELDPSDASVLDSFDSRNVGQPLKLVVTIKGKRDPGYSVPRVAQLNCTQDAGSKCKACPMNGVNGDARLEIHETDPVVLEMMESTKPQLEDIIRRRYGALKCSRLTVKPETYQAIEVLYARPSIEHATGGGANAYKNMKITSVGRHDTLANNTVQVTGALHPDPRKQLNEFLAWEVNKMATSLDHFVPSPETLAALKVFQPEKGVPPLKQIRAIATDLEQHVTKIYGRLEMHAAIDLVFHSVIAFPFGGQIVDRGWLELIIVGDTRTGKSEAGTSISRHYRAGEVVSCESASFAGIVGGLQQYGAGKEWAINWGAIPINDRRLVILDEISGLSYEDIGSMSDVRSRGLAQLTKIQQEATHARTRLIWMGNPRDGQMSDYTYGAQALKPLIGNPEDIARFDLAMNASAGEVESTEINRQHKAGKPKYSSEICSELVRWVWSRTADQISWAAGAEDAVRDAAEEMGKRYVESPPLVQAANIRVKIARVAVAMAARLFSSPDGERLVVNKAHVRDAVKFMDHIYAMPGFGYAEMSREQIADRQEGRSKQGEIKKWLMTHPGLSKFLRSNSSFRRQDLEEVMNLSREEANAIINTLWEARMVRKQRGDIRAEPVLHELLRQVKN